MDVFTIISYQIYPPSYFCCHVRWVNQCLGEANIYHDDNRRTTTFRYAGQNYASKSHSANLGEKFIAAMIQDLYDEVNIIQIYVYLNADNVFFLFLVELLLKIQDK
jgi:hypothetical protein